MNTQSGKDESKSKGVLISRTTKGDQVALERSTNRPVKLIPRWITTDGDHFDKVLLPA